MYPQTFYCGLLAIVLDLSQTNKTGFVFFTCSHRANTASISKTFTFRLCDVGTRDAALSASFIYFNSAKTIKNKDS